MAIIGVLAFVVALLLSVMIHEAGHYLTAKKFGLLSGVRLSLVLKQSQQVVTAE